MCEFCHQHGEGKKWYLQAKNYSEDLLSDLQRRHYIKSFLSRPEGMERSDRWLNLLDKTPLFFRQALARRISSRQKKVHFGQVVPIEEVEEIFSLVNSIVRISCFCRQTTLPRSQQERQRYCYAISLGPNGGKLKEIIQEVDVSYLTGPDTSGLEVLDKTVALAALKNHEREGLCHTVWTFHTPFIGGICNCNLEHCYALRTTLRHKVPVLFRAEYIASIDWDKCVGCKWCLRLCHFRGLYFDASLGKAKINSKLCHGCGICRSACPKRAIKLVQRNILCGGTRI